VRLSDCKTPALILDRTVLERNAAAMRERMQRLGVRLRPHMKTAKSARVAEIAAGSGGGITVSTLQEAAYFAEHGFRDLTYAVSMVPEKLDEAAAIQHDGSRLTLLTDDAGVARALAERARALGARFPVLIEIDCGGGRAGLRPDAAELPDLGRILVESECLDLEGVLTHAGHSYHCKGREAVLDVAEEERRDVTEAAARLRAAGLPCPVVSAGSTPTAVFAETLAGVTEMRPGTYMFGDLFQAGLGTCRPEDIAITVLATIIGHARAAGHLLLDAGSLALSPDTSASETMPGVGYGLVRDVAGRELPGLRVARVNQEHGFLEAHGTPPFDALPIGSKVRVLPNHACITAAMHDRYQVTEGGEEITDTWTRTNRW